MAVKIKSGDDLEGKTEKIGDLFNLKKKCLAVKNRPCDNISSAIDVVSNFIPSHFLKGISAQWIILGLQIFLKCYE